MHRLNHLNIKKCLETATEMFSIMDKGVGFADCLRGHDGAVPTAV